MLTTQRRGDSTSGSRNSLPGKAGAGGILVCEEVKQPCVFAAERAEVEGAGEQGRRAGTRRGKTREGSPGGSLS